MNSDNNMNGIDSFELDDNMDFGFDLQQAFDLLTENSGFNDDNKTVNSNSSYGSLDIAMPQPNHITNSDDKVESVCSSSFMDEMHWPGDMNISSSTLQHGIPQETLESGDVALGKKKRSFSDTQPVQQFGSTSVMTDAQRMLSDDDDSGDDMDDVKNDDGTMGGKSRKSSSRPNVREHSKAQREKRKGNISGLERQAHELTADLNSMNSQFISALEVCRSRRNEQHRVIVSFLKLWINDERSNVDARSGSGGSFMGQQPIRCNMSHGERLAKWAAFFADGFAPDNTGGLPLDLSVSMILPCTFSRFSPPMSANSYCSKAEESSFRYSFYGKYGGTRAPRILSTLDQIVADSTSLAVMCQNISEFGSVQICQFMMGIDVPLEDFISEELVAVAPFYLYSKNATMCGGTFEIDLKGYFHCEFSDTGKIKKVELCYDDWHLTEQLFESFGPIIYRPYSNISFGDEDFLTAESACASGEQSGKELIISSILNAESVLPRVTNEHTAPKVAQKVNTVSKESRIITGCDIRVIVESINSTAFEQFGSIVGRSLITADWLEEALSVLTQWAPYVRTLNTVSASTDAGGTTMETKCLLFPLYDKDLEADLQQAHHDASIPVIPNKICWVIFNHHSNSHEKQLAVIIEQFLHGCVTKFATKLNHIGSSCYFLSLMSLISQAELIISVDSDSEDERNSPCQTPSEIDRKQDLQDFLSMLEDFLRWMSGVESKIWSEDNPLIEVFSFNPPDSSDYAGGPPTRLSRLSLMQLEKSSNEMKLPDPIALSKGLAPNSQPMSSSISSIISSSSSVCSSRSSSRTSSISSGDEDPLLGDDREWTLFMELLDDINSFFTMLRESHVSDFIVSLLKSIKTPKEHLLLEELNAHCLTKHMNGRICYLMKHAKDMIQQQNFDRAVETLTEIIALDSSFMEAYNRRATALFGLHRAQECFSDLEHVLKASPNHYGALCGKGLLSMNLKAFGAAQECFEKALEVNPMLMQDEIILKSIEMCKQASSGS